MTLLFALILLILGTIVALVNLPAGAVLIIVAGLLVLVRAVGKEMR